MIILKNKPNKSMKEKIEKIGRIILKVVFLTSLFLTITFLVKIITPSYCIVHKVFFTESCNWQYSIGAEYRIIFTIAIFILTLFVITSFKKRSEK